jgi:hypothetical protein
MYKYKSNWSQDELLAEVLAVHAWFISAPPMIYHDALHNYAQKCRIFCKIMHNFSKIMHNHAKSCRTYA